MPSVEEILNARDGESTPASEEKLERVATDEAEESPRFEKADAPASTEPSEGEDSDDGKQVPLKALHAEREKSRRYTDEVVDLRRQISELSQAVLRQQQQPQPQAEPPKPPPEFNWDDPRSDIRGEVTTALQQERALIAAEFQRQREAVQSQFAVSRHGEETVKEAFAALADARATDPNWGMAYTQIMRSPDQYEAMVQWHRQRKALNEVGNDLEAYKARIKAEYLDELRNGRPMADAREESRRPAAMPSNLSNARSVGSRSGGTWEGPPSLKEIFANR